MKQLPIKRNWYICPYCKAKMLLYDNTASSQGLYLKCKKCKKEVEIVLHK